MLTDEPLRFDLSALNENHTVDYACEWTSELIEMECRAPGDFGEAMHRLAKKLRVPHNLLWRLRYRKPKAIGAREFFRILKAYIYNLRITPERFQNKLRRVQANSAPFLAPESFVRSQHAEV